MAAAVLAPKYYAVGRTPLFPNPKKRYSPGWLPLSSWLKKNKVAATLYHPER